LFAFIMSVHLANAFLTCPLSPIINVYVVLFILIFISLCMLGGRRSVYICTDVTI
jgi:hypothetical protein